MVSRDHCQMTTARDIVEQFCAERPGFARPRLAFNRCKGASLALERDLREAGFDARVLRLSGFQGAVDDRFTLSSWRNMRPFYWIHYVVEVDGEIFDPTARQFDSRSDFPMIGTRDDINDHWMEIERYVDHIEPEDLPTDTSSFAP